jgi:hypothetical protein
MLQMLKLAQNGSVVLIVCDQMHTLVHDGSSGVMLQVEQVLHVLGHHSHADVDVRTLEVGHDRKVLLPHGIFLIPNWEKCDGHRCGSGEAALTQGGECDVCHLLNGGVGIATDNSSRPWLHRVDGYHHAGLAYVQDVNHRQAVAVDRNFPVVAEMEECVV